jgi:hypothetical protein
MGLLWLVPILSFPVDIVKKDCWLAVALVPPGRLESFTIEPCDDPTKHRPAPYSPSLEFAPGQRLGPSDRGRSSAETCRWGRTPNH